MQFNTIILTKLDVILFQIWLDSERVELRNLKTAIPTTRGRSYSGIYQLCACENGRLFVAPPEKACQADNVVCK